MSSLIKLLQKFCDKLVSPDVPVEKKYRTLKAIREIEVTVEDIRITNLGKIVKKCTKLEGKPGLLAEQMIKKWKEMIYDNTMNVDKTKKTNYSELHKKEQEIKPAKTQLIEKSKKYYNVKSLEPGSDSESESSNQSESINRKQTKSRKMNYDDKNIKSKHNSSEDSLSNNSSSEEKFNSKQLKVNTRKSMSESEDEIPIPPKHLINNKISKENIRKTNKNFKNNKCNVDNSSGNDSSGCDEFIEMLSKNNGDLEKSTFFSNKNNNYNIQAKYPSSDDFSEKEYELTKIKTQAKPVRENQYPSDSESDEAYLNFLETEQEKVNSKKSNHSKQKSDPLDFLIPLNENKNHKKSIKTDKNNEMKYDNLSNVKEGNHKKEIKKPVEIKSSVNNIKTNSNMELNKPKARKSDVKLTSFEDFLKGSALTKSTEINPRKRKSETLHTQIDNKKSNLPLKNPANFIPTDLAELPALNSSLSNSDMDEQSVYNRTDIIFQKKDNHINEVKDDVDCTSKYSSERKIWTPKSRSDVIKAEVEENIRTINGVFETEIAQYSYEKLMAFDCDNRKIQRKTEIFWEKLFKKNHKSANRRDGETWREAYIRNQRDQDIRLKQLSERLKKTTEQNANAVTKAKLLTNSNLAKPKRRVTDMRR